MWWLLLACTTQPNPDLPDETGIPTTVSSTLPIPAAVEVLAERDVTAADYGLAEPWVLMRGGPFLMGSPSPADNPREEPQHVVTVPAFAVMRHEATMGDYSECVDDGVCMPRSSACYDDSNPQLPANCLNWEMSGSFCAWFGGRLPSESEWEYAATSGGRDLEYPWGNEEPDCTRANVNDGSWSSCGNEGIWEVCTHPAGDTPLGLCDMGGNAYEWIEDWFWDDYIDHPTDGSAREDMLYEFRGLRGGSIGSNASPRSRLRNFHDPAFYFGGMGVRCVKDLPPL